jgi:phage terminase large subunit-like protein
MPLTTLQWMQILQKVSESGRKEWIYESLKPKSRLHIFGKYFFPHIIKGSAPIPECHIDLIRELTTRRDGAIIFPRGFAKSTWEKIDTLHDIVYKLEPVILYISVTMQSAQFHFESIKGELEANDKLRNMYGNLVPVENSKHLQKQRITRHFQKWTSTHFETLNGVSAVARGCGKGRGVNIHNQRPTKVICDDIEDDEHIVSPVQREKIHNWLYSVIIPSLDKEKGFVKMIGTVIHPEAEVLKFYQAKGGIFRSAIEDGKSIWEDYWSLEDLIKIRDGYTREDGFFVSGIGTTTFSKEYMNDPVDDATSIFKRAWLERNIYEIMPPREWLTIVIAVDPNAGESNMADYMGITVLGLDRRDNLRYVLETRQEKVPINRQIEIVQELNKKWNPVRIGIEKVLNQTALYQLAVSKRTMPIIALSPSSKSKIDRARKVEPLVEQNVIKFNKYDTVLYNELIQFPNSAHDDVADSFFYANEMLSRTNASNASNVEVERSGAVFGNLMKRKF